MKVGSRLVKFQSRSLLLLIWLLLCIDVLALAILQISARYVIPASAPCRQIKVICASCALFKILAYHHLDPILLS